MKYFVLATMGFCFGAFIGDVVQGRYLEAIVMAVCVYVNYLTYCSAVKREQNRKNTK